MCGNFGVMVIDRSTVDHGKIAPLLEDLSLLTRIRGNSGKSTLTELGVTDKLRIARNYAQESFRNPSYFNSLLVDSLWAFYSSYILRDDHVYHYYPRLESEVEKTLIGEHGTDTTTTTAWRVGNCTAAFYNYVYYSVANIRSMAHFAPIRSGPA